MKSQVLRVEEKHKIKQNKIKKWSKTLAVSQSPFMGNHRQSLKLKLGREPNDSN